MNKKETLNEKLSIISSNVYLIRLFAAVMVIFCHSFYIASGKPDPLYVLSKGNINFGGVAVAVFFFYSGLYISKSLEKSTNIQIFIRRRFVRIFPQLWIVVAISVLVLGPMLTTCSIVEYFTSKQTYLYLLNGLLIPIHNLPGVFENNIYDASINGPLWTMPIEVMAYISLLIINFIALVILKKDKYKKIFRIACFIVLFVLLVIAQIYFNSEFLVMVIRPIVCFYLGCVFYDYSLKVLLNNLGAVFCCIILLVTLQTVVFNFLFVLMFPYVLLCISLHGRQISMKGIKDISYEMYLVGWPIQQTLTNICGGKMNTWLNFCISLCVDILIALIMVEIINRCKRKG